MWSVLAAGGRFGPYLIESRLGAGGMGVVYAATDTRLDRRVALKVVTGALADSPEFRERFAREATSLARVDSPHIVSIFEHGEHDGAPFIATQLVAGGDLAALVRARGPLSGELTLTIAAQLADALDDAHRVGVIHRDVKPGNILVRDPASPRPFVYLCDFGIAQTGDAGLTATGAVTGSWDYLAPERLEGGPGTPATDIYSLGCVLWTCATGTAPYQGSVLQVAQAHATAPVPHLPSSDEPAIRRLDGIIQRCLAKDPADRFTTAAELREALLDEDPTVIAVRPVAVEVDEDETLVRPARVRDETHRGRRPLRVVGAVAALALLVGGLAAAVARWNDGAGGELDAAGTSEASTAPPGLEPFDADRISVEFQRVVDDLFPHDTPTTLMQDWWSTEAENVKDSRPLPLSASERTQATSWSVDGAAHFSFSFVAPDSPAGWPPCDGMARCRDLDLGNDLTGTDQWTTSGDHVVTLFDGTRVALQFHEYAITGKSVRAMKKNARWTSAVILRAVSDPALLRFAAPAVDGRTPSLSTCVGYSDRPADCPSWIKAY